MNQPKITPGSNGYLAPVQQQDWQNPWTPMATADGAAAQTGISQGMGDLQSLTSQAQSYSQQSQPYPSFPNDGGFGSQNAYAGAPPAAQAPDSGSRGFNPWSLQGEANSR